jgi:hypothetical protein
MPGRDLTDLIVALLHHVTSPRHHCRGSRGGRCHRRPTPPQPPAASATPNPRVLERFPSPSLDRPAYRPMEPSDHDASPRGRHGCPCTTHGWGMCPNPIAPVVRSSSRELEGEEEEEEEPRRISERKTVGP